jgi:DNA recombination protein RmuC
MTLEWTILGVVGVLILALQVSLWRQMRSQTGGGEGHGKGISETLREELRGQRTELHELSRAQREELGQKLQRFKDESLIQIRDLQEALERGLHLFNEIQLQKTQELKADLQTTLDKNIQFLSEFQKEKLSQLDLRQQELVLHTERKLESIKQTVEEKLERTLSQRLGESFETVGKQLLELQKGLGEMQSLAQDVGGLKRVLSNVKMRGNFGEYQLKNILEQLMAPQQFEANVKVSPNKSELVEFAIKLPSKEPKATGAEDFIYLPIDAKFPKDIYESLLDAYDAAESEALKSAKKCFETTIKKMAKDIFDKYIDPPFTTDFAILFLPFEGVYAEVVRDANLLEDLQKKYRVIVTGPATLAAILNSLQVGFKTLAIEKRTSEVWRTLGAVKKEFEKFSDLLAKAKKNIETGLEHIEDISTTRTKAIQRQLREVEILDEAPKAFEFARSSAVLSDDGNRG